MTAERRNDPVPDHERQIELSEERKSLDSFFIAEPTPESPPTMQADSGADQAGGRADVSDFDG